MDRFDNDGPALLELLVMVDMMAGTPLGGGCGGGGSIWITPEPEPLSSGWLALRIIFLASSNDQGQCDEKLPLWESSPTSGIAKVAALPPSTIPRVALLVSSVVVPKEFCKLFKNKHFYNQYYLEM